MLPPLVLRNSTQACLSCRRRTAGNTKSVMVSSGRLLSFADMPTRAAARMNSAGVRR